MFPTYSRARHCLKTLLGIDPYQHQVTAAALMLAQFERSGSFALLHSMGTGKTLTALGVAGILHQRGDIKRVLVVCPTSVMGAWQNDGARLTSADIHPLTGASRAAKLQRILLTPQNEHLQIIILNYEMTWRLEHELRAGGFDLIICDESHRIKAPGSKQSRAMQRIGKTAKYRTILTGTPTAESALDIFGQYRFLDDRIFGTSFVNFQAKYATVVQVGPVGKTFPKVTIKEYMIPDLERSMFAHGHRVSKDQALDLPEIMPDIRTKFELSSKGRKIYDQLTKESIAFLSDGMGDPEFVMGDNILTRIMRQHQITGGWVRNDTTGGLTEVCDAKRKVLIDRLEDLMANGSKVILWHRFTREGEELRSIAGKIVGSARKPIAQPYVCGAVKQEDRRGMIRRFQEDDDSRIFIAQIKSVSEGVTLTAADWALYYSADHSSTTFEQSRDRNHRIGQDKRVTYETLEAIDTVDEDLFEALREKRDVAKELNDGGWKRWLRV